MLLKPSHLWYSITFAATQVMYTESFTCSHSPTHNDRAPGSGMRLDVLHSVIVPYVRVENLEDGAASCPTKVP
jgi:hypothetical protein